jgi:hypothetical protein
MAFHNDGKLLAAAGYQAACERNETLVHLLQTKGDNMANPIIVDCGGSTRIKRLEPNGYGDLNTLLDVDPNLNPPSATKVLNNKTFTQVAVAFIDSDGTATQDHKSQVIANDNFTITSVNGQSVVLQINGTNTSLTITVKGQQGNPPLMEAKHFNKKRRYVCINAGGITSIMGTANGAPYAFNAPANSIYVTLILNE